MHWIKPNSVHRNNTEKEVGVDSTMRFAAREFRVFTTITPTRITTFGSTEEFFGYWALAHEEMRLSTTAVDTEILRVGGIEP